MSTRKPFRVRWIIIYQLYIWHKMLMGTKVIGTKVMGTKNLGLSYQIIQLDQRGELGHISCCNGTGGRSPIPGSNIYNRKWTNTTENMTLPKITYPDEYNWEKCDVNLQDSPDAVISLSGSCVGRIAGRYQLLSLTSCPEKVATFSNCNAK